MTDLLRVIWPPSAPYLHSPWISPSFQLIPYGSPIEPPSPTVLHGLISFSPFSDLCFFIFLSPFPYDVTTCHYHLSIPFSGDSVSVFPFWIVILSPKLTPIMRAIYIRPVVAPKKKILPYLVCVFKSKVSFALLVVHLTPVSPSLLLVSMILILQIPQVLNLSPSCLLISSLCPSIAPSLRQPLLVLNFHSLSSACLSYTFLLVPCYSWELLQIPLCVSFIPLRALLAISLLLSTPQASRILPLLHNWSLTWALLSIISPSYQPSPSCLCWPGSISMHQSYTTHHRLVAPLL